MEGIAFGEGAGYLHPVKIFQAGEAAESFASIRDFLLGVESVEGVAVGLGEAYAVILNPKAVNLLEAIDYVGLSVSENFDFDQAVLYAFCVDGLNRIHDQLYQRCVYIGAGTNVLDQPLDVDIAHAKFPGKGDALCFTRLAVFGS
ncbi:hypothetical protein [Nitrobacter winogradskyi]|uniref:Uncharacterized protein n=1 Tax=Nitrobacter winogradskyi TaxID=913 RepID=A0ACC6AF49_NITWI|nr:hypothetical protein [Nitrobacter winogradskyi]MCP1997832.1 hypothetical protein [Nitrobacter winogradskyi]